MPNIVKIAVITLLVVVSLSLSFGAGCVLVNRTSPGPASGLDIITEAWDVIFSDYVDQSRLDASVLSQGAIRGLVEALDDPYSAYLDPETYQMTKSDLAGSFEGIGAYVGVEDKQIVVIAPIPDSPAARAGIKAGDAIMAVDGQPTAEMSLAEVVLHIRGPKDTPVRLLIRHQGEAETEEVEIVRAEIELPSVHFEMKGDITYINITYFSERTNEELLPVLASISQQAATGIILDLRSNPGGLLETVVDVASHFLKEGVVVDVVDNQGRHTTSSVKPGELTTDLPVVILVDGFSASGSEVLSGALQDYGRATIAGARTYGKGSIDILRKLGDGSGLYLTTARWLTPHGRPIEGEGITPDYELDLENVDAIAWAIDYLEGVR